MQILYLLILLYAIIGRILAQTCITPNGVYVAGACKCAIGYYGANADQTTGSCTICPNNSTTQLATLGDVSICSVCPQNYYLNAVADPSQPSPSSATCLACPGGSGTSGVSSTTSTNYDLSQCNICKANYYMTAIAKIGNGSVNPTAAQCAQCPANSRTSANQASVSNLYTACQCIDDNAIPLSSSQSICVCKNGMAGRVTSVYNASSGCGSCAPNFFSQSGSPCTTCAAGSTISTDQGSCTCNDSSPGTEPWSPLTNLCQCAVNYYGNPSNSTAGQTGSCSPCPNGGTSSVGSLTCTTITTGSLFLTSSTSLLLSCLFIIYHLLPSFSSR